MTEQRETSQSSKELQPHFSQSRPTFHTHIHHHYFAGVSHTFLAHWLWGLHLVSWPNIVRGTLNHGSFHASSD